MARYSNRAPRFQSWLYLEIALVDILQKATHIAASNRAGPLAAVFVQVLVHVELDVEVGAQQAHGAQVEKRTHGAIPRGAANTERTGTVALRRKHTLQAVVRNLPGPWLASAETRERSAWCVQAAGPEPRPDVQRTPRGAANAERYACARRGQTRCRPDGRARPRGGGRPCLARARPGEEHLRATAMGAA